MRLLTNVRKNQTETLNVSLIKYVNFFVLIKKKVLWRGMWRGGGCENSRGRDGGSLKEETIKTYSM